MNCVVSFFVGFVPVFTAQDTITGDWKPATSIVRQASLDARLKPPRRLSDAYHPWQPPSSQKEWIDEAHALRERILVSTGLWPWPSRSPLGAVIHGRIERDSYTVDKVYFSSLPGHYVSGSLYRPKAARGKLPAVLSPHGHWQGGRFHDAGEKVAKEQLKKGAESNLNAARYPLQARMAQLVRMGCIVFHYDMVGYGSSHLLEHGSGFNHVSSILRLQNFMGLQTWNSVRALDFLLSISEVDPDRIGVTGASGGGTQTFVLGAIDPRPSVAFPAVMVSTAMQGGCICENASYLRIGLNNVALAAMFAPRPLGLTGANDWTLEIESKGLPELKQVYGLYGAEDRVFGKAYPQFQHNYNQVARQHMYDWFNQHLQLGLTEPVREQDFRPISPHELEVFDERHPLPSGAKGASELRADLTETARKQFSALTPKDVRTAANYRRVVGTAARVLLDCGVPRVEEIEIADPAESTINGVRQLRTTIGRKNCGEVIPLVALIPSHSRRVVVWIDGAGKSSLFDSSGAPLPPVASLLEEGCSAISADVFLTGEYCERDRQVENREVDPRYAGYTYCYNRPLLSNRVRDILTAIAAAHSLHPWERIDLVGTGEAGPWVILARAVAADHVTRTVADLRGFGFDKIKDPANPMLLPGALKYGGIGGFAALTAPHDLILFGVSDAGDADLEPLRQMYAVSGGTLALHPPPLTPEEAVGIIIQ